MVQLNELENTLWGIVLQGSARYEHKSERPVHISMASLDTSVESDEFVPVQVETSSTTKYIMCTLNKPHVLQQPIELELNSGETVTFSLGSKKGAVHLTGYYLVDSHFDEDEADSELGMAANGEEHVHGPGCSHGDEDDEDDDDEMDDDDDDDEEDDEDEDDILDQEDDEDDDDEDDDEEDDEFDEDDEDEEEEAGNKRKIPITEKPQLAKKAKEENGDKAPKLVPNESQKKPEAPQAKTLAGGITIVDTKVGHGPEAKNGKVLSMYYAGRLKQNGKQFDALTSGKPFTFRLGRGDVIKGWDIGVQGMKVGGKRTITVPPQMGYGNRKSGPIPPNSTLVFDVELKAVN